MVGGRDERKKIRWIGSGQPGVGVGIAILFVVLAASSPAESGSPTNFVLILADDLGYGDLGCYGNRGNETPHIDALAASGLRFTDFHSSGPMCTPTRVATLTGLYQQRFGSRFDTAISGVKDRDRGLPHEAVTIAEVLRPLEYRSACFGKWHLGYQPPWLPTSQGFDLFRGLVSGDGDFHTRIDRSGNEDWWHNERIEMVRGYTTDLLTEYSVAFIEQNRKRPFFLYVPHLAIHFPWQGPDDPPHRRQGQGYHRDKWGVIPDPENVATHVRAMVESLDRSVGLIVGALRKWDLDKNTLVIFTSDNGGYLTYGDRFRNISSNGPFRGQKTELYEGGHRVPAIFSWPGRIEPGVSEETAHSVDLMPTLAALAGVDVETDGVDLGPLLFSGDRLPERTLYWRARLQAAVRRGEWKWYRNGKKEELYHLGDDPGEERDLAPRFPERVAGMRGDWETWEKDVNRSAAAFSP